MLRTLVLCCVVTFTTVPAASAQSGQADITPFGDWKSGKRGEIKATALNDPGISLHVLCSGDIIDFELDPPLSGLSSDVNKPVYIMTDRTAPAFEKAEGWLVHGKTGLTVHADRRWFKDADSVTFCPVEDVTTRLAGHSACAGTPLRRTRRASSGRRRNSRTGQRLNIATETMPHPACPIRRARNP